MRRRRFQKSSLQLRQILCRASVNLSNTTPRSGQFVKYDVQQRTIWNICPSVKLHFLRTNFLVDVPHVILGPLPGLGVRGPAVQHQLIQLAGQSVAPQVLAGQLAASTSPKPRVGGRPPYFRSPRDMFPCSRRHPGCWQ